MKECVSVFVCVCVPDVTAVCLRQINSNGRRQPAVSVRAGIHGIFHASNTV